jgi:hypothetical protein
MYGKGRLSSPAFTRNNSNRLHHAAPMLEVCASGAALGPSSADRFLSLISIGRRRRPRIVKKLT